MMLGYKVFGIASLLLTAVAAIPSYGGKGPKGHGHSSEKKCLTDQEAVEITQTYGKLFQKFDLKVADALVADGFQFISDSFAAVFAPSLPVCPAAVCNIDPT